MASSTTDAEPKKTYSPQLMYIKTRIPYKSDAGSALPAIEALIFGDLGVEKPWRCAYNVHTIDKAENYVADRWDSSATVEVDPLSGLKRVAIRPGPTIFAPGRYIIRIRAWEASSGFGAGYGDGVPHSEGWTERFEVVSRPPATGHPSV